MPHVQLDSGFIWLQAVTQNVKRTCRARSRMHPRRKVSATRSSLLVRAGAEAAGAELAVCRGTAYGWEYPGAATL